MEQNYFLNYFPGKFLEFKDPNLLIKSAYYYFWKNLTRKGQNILIQSLALNFTSAFQFFDPFMGGTDWLERIAFGCFPFPGQLGSDNAPAAQPVSPEDRPC